MGSLGAELLATRWTRGWAAVIGAAILATAFAGQATAEPFIAGVAPHERPQGAPKITAFQKSQQWYAAALAGIEEPIPPTLRVMEDQGAWYTPFLLRGMPHPYDIRGRHKPSAPARGN